MNDFALEALPAPCDWVNSPTGWKAWGGNNLAIAAGPKTDWFRDPSGGAVTHNAPAAIFTPPDESALLSARVSVSFASTFDAGVLLASAGEDLWAKLCFELSPRGKPMIVSVVTKGLSDDCDSVVVRGREVHLRLAMMRKALAFHYSLDGRLWHLVRHFGLGAGVRLGFLCQSPTGGGCEASFAGITYRAGELRDIRSGE
jgi:uncharacterized protein